MTNEHTTLEKYTSHPLFERVVTGLCVRDELETARYWPPVPLTIAALLFSFFWAAQPEILRAQALCWELVLTASNCNLYCNWLQLLELSVAPGYIIVWRTPASCERSICTEFNPSTVKVISSTGCTCFSIDGWVEGQYIAITYLLAIIFTIDEYLKIGKFSSFIVCVYKIGIDFSIALHDKVTVLTVV